MPSPAYQILPTHPTDAASLAAIFLAAFSDDKLLGQTWKGVDAEQNLEYWTRVFHRNLGNAERRLEREGREYLKVCDGEGKMLAFIDWQYPHTVSSAQRVEKEAEEESAESLPPGSNLKLRDAFFGALDEKKAKYLNSETDYFLHLLCTSPSHQRQGLASMLIKEGLQRADAAGAKTYIEASPKGLKLYESFGWKVVDEILIDTREYGVEGGGVVCEKLLVREPKAKMERNGDS